MGIKKIKQESRGLIAWLISPSNYAIEIIILLIWVLWVGRAYLNFDLNLWPYGREYGLNVRTHYIWETAKQCGTCMFWNGSIGGGSPAFAELQGAVLHPIAILATLLAGVVNGSKLILLASLFMAGAAQWWLAKSMQVGRLARLWSAGMAVVGGHLASRMELGLVTMVLSTAACVLALTAGVDLVLTGKRRAAILFGCTLALAIVSGQGYMQVGFLLCILPAFLIFVLAKKQEHNQILWKEFLLAGVLALLLAGVFLVPLLHFSPNMGKPVDPLFGSAQPLAYIPLNLVIDDMAYYRSEILKPTAFPNLYANYLGWVPVLLALLALRFKPRNSIRLLVLFLVMIGLSFLAGSGLTSKLLIFIIKQVDQLRFVSYFAGLANPVILCLAACGLEGLLKLKVPRLSIASTDANDQVGKKINVNVIKLLILVPLFFALKSAYTFGQQWLTTPAAPQDLTVMTSSLKTNKTEWISVPGGDHFWNISAIGMGLKLGDGMTPWYWKNRPLPAANIAATRDPAVSSNYYVKQTVNDIKIIVYPENEYAYIVSGEQKITCSARATGGNIDVSCPDNPGGTLVVTENNWAGWIARSDQKRIPLLDSNWLSVEAPAGEHTFSFRYQPWDVWVGFLLTLIGTAASIFLWIKAGKQTDLSKF